MFILPPLFFLRIHYMTIRQRARKEGTSVLKLYQTWSVWKDLTAVVILLVGVLLMIVENYVSVRAVVVSSHGPIGLCQQLLCNHTENTSAISGYG